MPIYRGVQKTPWKILIYGRPGLGKSTLAGLAPDALMLNIEDRLDRIDAVKTHHITEWSEIYSRVKEKPGIINEILETGSYDGFSPKTLVYDTTTALEKILDPVATASFNFTNEKTFSNTEEIPYGKGSGVMQAQINLVLDISDLLKKKHGINTVFVGHDTVEKMTLPNGAEIDQYTIQSMHKKTREVFIDRCDGILYAVEEGNILSKEKGFGRKQDINIKTGNCVLHCLSGTGFVAKNSFNLNREEPMDKTIYTKLDA